jgi:hypothetical protein
MLTVLIETKDSEEALARTLASLVSGAVQGVVRDVIVADRGSTDQTRRVAEHAGCHVVATGLADALGQAKGEWLLILEPGSRLLDGWIGPVAMHVSNAGGAARFTRMRLPGARWFSGWFTKQRPLSRGLLILKDEAIRRRTGDAQDLARLRPISRLEALIVTAP